MSTTAATVQPAPPQSTRAPSTASRVSRLYLTEMRLFLRESQALFFIFGFPIITVLVLGGVFGTETDDPGFEYINPSHYFVAAYYGVTLAAVGLIMLPQHIAGYRERGVLRRFGVSGFPAWAFPAVQFLAGLTFALLGFAALTATAALSYGAPPIEDLARTLIGVVLGTLAFVSIGVALGSLLPSARAAGSFGLASFFPMFLLAGGGPPPEAMPSAMRTIADVLPLTHVIRAIQEPWLGLGNGTNHLVVVVGLIVVASAGWLRAAGRVTAAA